MRELGWPSLLQLLTDIASGNKTPDLLASLNHCVKSAEGVESAEISGKGKATPWPNVNRHRSFSNKVIS